MEAEAAIDNATAILDNLRIQQRMLLQSPFTCNALIGGIGTFKTTAVILDMDRHCELWPGQYLTAGGQDLQQLRSIFLEKWRQLVPGEGSRWTFNHNSNRIQYHATKSVIQFERTDYAFDDARKAQPKKGADVTGYLLFQADEMPDAAWFMTQHSRVRRFVQPGNSGRVGGMCHPGHRTWIDMNAAAISHWSYGMFYDPDSPEYLGRDNEEGYPLFRCIVVPSTPETSIYTQRELDGMKRRMRPALYDRLVNCQFTELEGLVYPSVKVRDADPDPAELLHISLGIDPGHGEHESGIVFLGKLHSGSYCIVDEWKEALQDRGMEYISEIVCNKLEYWTSGGAYIETAVIDWAHSGYKENLPKFITDAAVARKSPLVGNLSTLPGHEHELLIELPGSNRGKWGPVLIGCELVEAAFRRENLTIAPRCVMVQRERAGYAFRNGIPNKQALDPHLLDGLRYVWTRTIQYDPDATL